MGGGISVRSEDVHRVLREAPRASTAAFDYDAQARSGAVRGTHPDLDPYGQIREVVASLEHPHPTLAVFMLDTTESRGDDPKKVYELLPHYVASLVGAGFPDPELMFVGVGDANSDTASIQVSQAESDRRMDAHLAKLNLEKGGGGTGQESYQLAAWYLVNRLRLVGDCNKPWIFILADERPYEVVSRAEVKRLLGVDIPADVPTSEVFARLNEMYNVFVIMPRTTAEQRRASIDNEIRQRLIAAGGRFQNVAIRASLGWNTFDDLDLHCYGPGGFHIFFGNKAEAGGELDVDANGGGAQTRKPVENIRFPQGLAPKGVYRIAVRNYRFQDQSGSSQPIPFRVELDVRGAIQHYDGIIPARSEGASSEQTIFTFAYDPDAPTVDAHAAYDEKLIDARWAALVPAVRILHINDAYSTLDTALGAMHLQSGKMSLDQFLASLAERPIPVSPEQIADIRAALTPFATRGVVPEIGNPFAE